MIVSSDAGSGAPARHGRRSRSTASGGERIRFGILVGFLILCALGGGASRADVLSLIYLRPAAVLCILALALAPGRWYFAELRGPLIFFAALVAAAAVQLIPLPPQLWLMLPGRAHFAEAAAAAGLPQPWHMITLTPDLTINSLLAFLPPLAVLIGLAGISVRQRQQLLPIVLLVICASAILGIVQLTSAPDSPTYFYRIRHENSAVGLFANRNHQAALLALAFPLLRLWTLVPAANATQARNRVWIAIAVALFLIPLMLVVGSRAGLAVGVLAAVAALGMVPRQRGLLASLRDPWRRIATVAVWAIPAAMVGIVMLLGRAVAIQRLFLLEQADNQLRLLNAPLTFRMARDFFPIGSGFGSFDPIFRGYEPDAALSPLYFNHAHNDLIELAITGGAPALLVLLLFLGWWTRRSWQAFVPFRNPSVPALFARAATVGTLLLFLASLIDYPLRTPLMGVILVILCVWLTGSRRDLAGD